jgi:hypothetical protein
MILLPSNQHSEKKFQWNEELQERDQQRYWHCISRVDQEESIEHVKQPKEEERARTYLRRSLDIELLMKLPFMSFLAHLRVENIEDRV